MDDIASMKVTELKSALADRGLPTTGVKKPLADRLIEYEQSQHKPTPQPPKEELANKPTQVGTTTGQGTDDSCVVRRCV